MKLHLSVLFLEYIFFAYAEPLKGDKVTEVGRKYFKKDKISSVVSISIKNDQYHEEYTHFCTGVLITSKFVLTAEHCFRKKLWGEIRVIAGSVDLRKGTKYYPEKWITYDRWTEIRNETKAFSTNDIAIIKLSEGVKRSVAVPASLSTKPNHEIINKDVVLVGWGTTEENPDQASRCLNRVDIKVLYNEDCEQFISMLLNRVIVIPDQYFCTKGYPHALIGLGDSGGPVLRKNVVLGINTGVCPLNYTCDWPEDIINMHKINLHTGIYPYRKFIYDVLENSNDLIV